MDLIAQKKRFQVFIKQNCLPCKYHHELPPSPKIMKLTGKNLNYLKSKKSAVIEETSVRLDQLTLMAPPNVDHVAMMKKCLEQRRRIMERSSIRRQSKLANKTTDEMKADS